MESCNHTTQLLPETYSVIYQFYLFKKSIRLAGPRHGERATGGLIGVFFIGVSAGKRGQSKQFRLGQFE